jgi:hypothetical protein
MFQRTERSSSLLDNFNCIIVLSLSSQIKAFKQTLSCLLKNSNWRKSKMLRRKA